MMEIICDGSKIRFYNEEDGCAPRIDFGDAISIYQNLMELHLKRKEENTMKVSYKGITGLLQKLERQEMAISCGYILEIWDCSRECKISFSGVSLKDVKFLGGEVTYG